MKLRLSEYVPTSSVLCFSCTVLCSVAMTILPKKKKGEQQSDSDSDSSGNSAQSPCSHVGVSGHGGSPHPSEDTNYHHSPEGFYHR